MGNSHITRLKYSNIDITPNNNLKIEKQHEIKESIKDNLLDNNNSNDINIINTFSVKISKTTDNLFPLESVVTLVLTDNYLIIKNRFDFQLSIIYQKIHQWYTKTNRFGFHFLDTDKIIKIFEFITTEGVNISSSIKDITQDLVEYYKEM